MIGTNELQFNTATMMKVVQHYLDTVLLKEDHSATVASVLCVNTGTSAPVFRIILVEQNKAV